MGRLKADIVFVLTHLPAPAMIVMAYGALVLGLAERGRILLATFVVMAATWLVGIAKDLLP